MTKKEDNIIDKLQKSIDKNKDTPEFKEYMKELTKSVDDYKHRHDEARKYGKAVGKRFVKKYKAIPYEVDGKTYHEKGLETDDASAALAEILYQCFTVDQSEDCEDLLSQWTQEKLWGKIVKQYIPTLKEVWQYLHDNKYTKNNTLGYGDADGAIWVEYPRQEEKWPDKRNIIIHRSHCTCADDDTHIFVLDDSKWVSMFSGLHVRTVWPRENSRGIHKYRTIPSINTYRKNNFKSFYGDDRDKGYVLTLKEVSGTPSIDGASLHQGRIQSAIYLIGQMKDIITDESYQCK